MRQVTNLDLSAGERLNAAAALRPEPRTEGPRTPRVAGEMQVVRALFDALNEKGVRYCHWKSNIRLDETLAGKQDIDLLVDPRDWRPFHAAMLENGYRLARSRAGLGHPGVFHALALDEASGRLVDLHVYHQVVSGDSFVKNYRLPIEDELLAGTELLHGVKVPGADAELALFAIRMALKHLSPVEIAKVGRHYDKVTAELDWLRARADDDRAAELCTRWFPGIRPALLHRLLAAIADEGNLLRRIRLGWRVARRLRGLRRLGALPAFASRQWRLLAFAGGRLRRRRDLSLQTGGAIVALVGPKGTGKSTIGGELAGRLGRYLNLRRIHAGKPPATALSFLPRLFVPLARAVLPGERLAEYQRPERRRAKRFSLLYVFRMTLVAYDRRRLLRRAARAATSGTIVLCDRYPSATVGATDSSCFDDAALAATRSRVKRWLMTRERALYRDLPRPRLVIRLVAPLETALQRDAARGKPGGPDPDAICRRWSLESEAAFEGGPTIEIDASQPLEDTARAVVRAVWSRL